MAKKTSSPTTPRRRQPKRDPAAAPVDIATVAGTEPLDSAADHSSRPSTPDAAHNPSREQIAEAAYHRYLERGGQDGNDFDDWLEAERELRSRVGL